MNDVIGWLVLLLAGGAPVLGLYLWLRLVRSKDGERYLRQQKQGPFVPSGEEKHE
jgi:hypothetical protein